MHRFACLHLFSFAFASFCVHASVFFRICIVLRACICFLLHLHRFACLPYFLLHFASFCVPLCFICISLALLHRFACPHLFSLASASFYVSASVLAYICTVLRSRLRFLLLCTVFHTCFRFPLAYPLHCFVYRSFVFSPAFALGQWCLLPRSSHVPGFARFGTLVVLLSTWLARLIPCTHIST